MERAECYRPAGQVPGPVLRDEQADRALLARLSHQERAALAELYERFQQPLFGYLFRLTGNQGLAEDLLQEVMLTVWQKAGTFRGEGQVASSKLFLVA